MQQRQAGFVAALVLILSAGAWAQQGAGDRPELRVTDTAGKPRPLALAKADIQSVITGYLAQTTMVLTFRNETDRVLEGELVFPLPEGATVSGYGLDVGGTVVDGVPVEKLKARVTFETEVRKGVDPGLVEHVKGNNFRTRVYPIPARGTRTVKVQYVAELAQTDEGPGYVLPLNWGADPVGQLSLKVELVRPAVEPVLRGGERGLAAKRVGQSVLIERTYENARFTNDLSIVLPNAPTASAIVEKRTAGDGKAEHFFVIHDTPAVLGQHNASARVQRVGILWDASQSRAEADKKRETELLRQLIAAWKDVRIDLVVFRDTAEDVVTFEAKDGKAETLFERLEALPYDGGTDMGSLAVPRQGYDLWLMFTDGLGNLGREMPEKPAAPLYVISNDARSNHAVLSHLAQSSGGGYFNLKRVPDAQVLDSVGHAAFSFLGVDAPAGAIDGDLYPTGVTPVHGRFTVAGKLLAAEAKVTLKYGYGNQVVARREFVLKQQNASETGLAARQWAQQKAGELGVFEEKNREALLALGREFNIVTANTSLMVLETLEQHLQYDIAPAKSRGEMYAAFMEKKQGREQQKKQTAEQKIETLAKAWEQRTNWWETEFKYPKDFRYTPPADEGKSGRPGTQPAAPLVRAPAPRRPAEERHAAEMQLVDALREAEAAQRTPEDRRHPDQPRGGSGGGGGLFGGGGAGRGGEARGRGEADFNLANETAGGRGSGGQNSAGEGRGNNRALLVGGGGSDQAPSGQSPGDASIAVKAWNPDTPYLKAIKAAGPAKAYAVYLEQRKQFAASPAFYLDCADWFVANNQRKIGLRILSNIAELQLDSPALLRVAAHRLAQIGERDLAIDLFDKVLKLRAEEPQSYRDLALALAERAEQVPPAELSGNASARADLARAMDLLNQVVTRNWDNRFEQIEVIALMELNRLAAKAATVGIASPLDARLSKLLDLDVRIVLTWDADATDIDLYVTEPSGETAFYGHNRTTIGGVVSRDFTQGYGPEEYALRRAMPGQYTIKANFFGSSQQKVTGPTTVQATVITNFGRPSEKRQSLTLRLTDRRESVEIGKITIAQP